MDINSNSDRVDDLIDAILENSYDFFDVDYPAGWEAGWALHVKDNEGLTKLIGDSFDQVLEEREITLKSILKDVQSWLSKKLLNK